MICNYSWSLIFLPLYRRPTLALLIYSYFYLSLALLIGNGYQWRWAVIASAAGGGLQYEMDCSLNAFPLAGNLYAFISRTVSPTILMECFPFNCHIITIIIRAVNNQQGRRQPCHINHRITSAAAAPRSAQREGCWEKKQREKPRLLYKWPASADAIDFSLIRQ